MSESMWGNELKTMRRHSACPTHCDANIVAVEREEEAADFAGMFPPCRDIEALLHHHRNEA